MQKRLRLHIDGLSRRGAATNNDAPNTNRNNSLGIVAKRVIAIFLAAMPLTKFPSRLPDDFQLWKFLL